MPPMRKHDVQLPLVVVQAGPLRCAREARGHALRPAREVRQALGERHADDRQRDRDHGDGESAQTRGGEGDEQADAPRGRGTRARRRATMFQSAIDAVRRDVGAEADEEDLAERDLAGVAHHDVEARGRRRRRRRCARSSGSRTRGASAAARSSARRRAPMTAQRTQGRSRKGDRLRQSCSQPSDAHHRFPAEQALWPHDEHDEDEDERHRDLQVVTDERHVDGGEVLEHADQPRGDHDADRARQAAEDARRRARRRGRSPSSRGSGSAAARRATPATAPSTAASPQPIMRLRPTLHAGERGGLRVDRDGPQRETELGAAGTAACSSSMIATITMKVPSERTLITAPAIWIGLEREQRGEQPVVVASRSRRRSP